MKKLIQEKINEIREKHLTTADKNINLKILNEIAQLRGGKIKEGENYINNSSKMTFVDQLGNEFEMTPNKIKIGQWSTYESGSVRDSNYHMKQLEEIASKKMGKIKEGEIYINNNTKIIFIDKLSNEFKMTPHAVKSGYWSPYEVGKVRDPDYHIKELEKIALSKGGKIKDGEVYVNNATKMRFIDKLHNEFEMTPNSVKSGSWSPYEVGKVRDPDYHMKELEEIALSKGGKIKEGELYVNSTTKMIFIDKLDNEFKMTPSDIKSGSWSPYESGNVFNNPEYHMKQLEEFVLSKGGKIKEGEDYINSNTKIRFIDKLGNEFKMTPSAVKSGQWSPYEAGNVFNNPDFHIQKLSEIALAKGGKIKEGQNYINKSSKMTFIDQLGNEFKMTPHAVKSGQWSPYEKNYSEHICRQIIEQLYNKKFPSCWDIIKREGKRNLQLDGYNNELKIAFEYQGVQHSTGWFNKNELQQEKSLAEMQERDNEKKKICIENNILLLEINYYKTTKNLQDIINQTIKDIKKSYEINNKDIPDFINNMEIDKIKIDLSKISHLVLMQKQLEEIVLSKGGRIKEGEQYINSFTKMTFIDQLDNEFEMIPAAVKSGQWSPYESGNVRDSNYHMTALQKITLSKGGKIKEGEDYINSNTKMRFIDQLGNEFEMTPSAVKSGQWSPYESGTVRDSDYHMTELQKIALSKGGKIKEGEIYINNVTKMTFIDKLDNAFKMKPNDIKNGHWSPYESGKVRDPDYHMKQLEEIVLSKGGKIKEGEVYVNAKTKMIFIDELGNEFEMKPNSVKNGQWSPYKNTSIELFLNKKPKI